MKKGILYTIAAYFLWGFIPIFFKAIQDVPATQIMCHRFVWSFFTLAIVILLRHDISRLRGLVTLRILMIYLAAGVLLAINWLTYVWAVINDNVVESSLGYFINPLVSVSLGVIFLRERLRPLQWLPVGLATLGVAYLTISQGQLPWIALVIAFSFGLYGLVKKVAPLNSLHGLTLETAVLFLPALAYLFVEEGRGIGLFAHTTPVVSSLLALSGPITVVPLLFFAGGARRIPLSMLGILQYISPTIQFLLGVLIYHEPFASGRIVGFAIVWLALIIFSIDGYLYQRRVKAAAVLRKLEAEERIIP